MDKNDQLFMQLLYMFHTSAMQGLGKIADPTGQVNRNLEYVSQTIDLMTMLKEKTKGNISDDIDKMLEGMLSELRLNYVDEKSKSSDKKEENKAEDLKKDKKVNDTITIQVISSDSKGLTVKPEGSDLQLLIKKSQIAVSSADARPSRFINGDRIVAAIAELNFEKRKVTLSIKLLEELMNAKAIKEHSSPLSGKNLPFSSLSEQLDDKKNKKESE